MAPRLRMTPTAVLLWHRNLHTPHSTMAIDSGNPVCPRLGWPHRPQSGCPVRRDERSEGLKLNEIRNTRHEIRDTKVSKRETRRERHLNATLTVYSLCTVSRYEKTIRRALVSKSNETLHFFPIIPYPLSRPFLVRVLAPSLLPRYPDRFLRVAISNTALPVGGGDEMSATFKLWAAVVSQQIPQWGMLVSGGTTSGLSEAAMEAYDAPFPSEDYKAATRV